MASSRRYPVIPGLGDLLASVRASRDLCLFCGLDAVWSCDCPPNAVRPGCSCGTCQASRRA